MSAILVSMLPQVLTRSRLPLSHLHSTASASLRNNDQDQPGHQSVSNCDPSWRWPNACCKMVCSAPVTSFITLSHAFFDGSAEAMSGVQVKGRCVCRPQGMNMVHEAGSLAPTAAAAAAAAACRVILTSGRQSEDIQARRYLRGLDARLFRRQEPWPAA